MNCPEKNLKGNNNAITLNIYISIALNPSSCKCNHWFRFVACSATNNYWHQWLIFHETLQGTPQNEIALQVLQAKSWPFCSGLYALIHWGQLTHICISKLTIIDSYSGLSSDRRQASIWTMAVILLIRTLGTKFSEILSEIHIFSCK